MMSGIRKVSDSADLVDTPEFTPSDLLEEKSCSLENYLILPDHTMDKRIASARAQLGDSTILLGHHYQRDEVIRFADATGDSYRLSKLASATKSRYVIFCGVHFMAESADILGANGQTGDFARFERRVLDGRHGGDRAGGRLLGIARGGQASISIRSCPSRT